MGEPRTADTAINAAHLLVISAPTAERHVAGDRPTKGIVGTTADVLQVRSPMIAMAAQSITKGRTTSVTLTIVRNIWVAHQVAIPTRHRLGNVI